MSAHPQDARPGATPLTLRTGAFVLEEVRILTDTGRVVGLLLHRSPFDPAMDQLGETVKLIIWNMDLLA